MLPIVAMDFIGDLDRITTHRLGQWGYREQKNDDAADRFWMLMSLTERGILPIKAEVHYSAEIRANPKFTTHAEVLEEIVQRLTEGAPMRPYLSKNAVKPRNPDGLLDHWRIHHLHLNSIRTLDDEGFVARADDLLFLKQDESNVYLLDIVPHAQKHKFSDPRLLHIIQNNWSQLLPSHAEVTGDDLTPSEVQRFRKLGVGVMLNIGGRAVLPEAVMTNGVPIRAFAEYRFIRDILTEYEDGVRRQFYVCFPRCGAQAALGIRRFFNVILDDIADTHFVLRESGTGEVAYTSKPPRL